MTQVRHLCMVQMHAHLETQKIVSKASEQVMSLGCDHLELSSDLSTASMFLHPDHVHHSRPLPEA